MNTATRPAGGGSHWCTNNASTKQTKDGARQTNVRKRSASDSYDAQFLREATRRLAVATSRSCFDRCPSL